MKRKRKLNLIELLLSIVVIIIGSICTYNVAVNGLYSIGADNIFKSVDNCKDYKELYITEMKKGQPNNTSSIIQEAKKYSCTK